jgi:hypothetical protein
MKIKLKPGILISVVIVVIVVAVLMIVGSLKMPKTTPVVKFKPLEKTKLAEIVDDIKGVSGKIIAVNKDTITVEVLLMMKNTAKVPIKHEIKVMADNSTLITKLTFPSPEKLMGNKNPIVPKEETLQISDLKIGDTADIRADKNIYDSLETGVPFVASTINVIAYE